MMKDACLLKQVMNNSSFQLYSLGQILCMILENKFVKSKVKV